MWQPEFPGDESAEHFHICASTSQPWSEAWPPCLRPHLSLSATRCASEVSTTLCRQKVPLHICLYSTLHALTDGAEVYKLEICWLQAFLAATGQKASISGRKRIRGSQARGKEGQTPSYS